MNKNIINKLVFREIKNDIISGLIELGIILLTMAGILFVGLIFVLVFLKFGFIGFMISASIILISAIIYSIFCKFKLLYNEKKIECEKLDKLVKNNIMVYAYRSEKYDKDSLIEFVSYGHDKIYKQLVSECIDELSPELLELKNGNIPEKYKNILDK